jgi:hypothetical protein
MIDQNKIQIIIDPNSFAPRMTYKGENIALPYDLTGEEMKSYIISMIRDDKLKELLDD